MSTARERYKRNQAKKAKKKSSSKSKLSSIDYSKRKKGTSRREYAAQQLGGTLDYDKNTITVKSKKPSSSSGTKSGPSRAGEVNPGYYNPYTQQVQTTKVSDYDTDKKAQSNRSNASKIYNARTGSGSKGNASGGKIGGSNIRVSDQNPFGKFAQWGNEALGYGYGKLTGSEDKMLGLTQQLFGGDTGITESPWVKRATDLFGVPTANAFLRDDPEAGGHFRDPSTVSPLSPQDIGTSKENLAISNQIAAGNKPVTNYRSNNPEATYEKDIYGTSNISVDDDTYRPDPTPTDGGSDISTPSLPEIFQTKDNPFSLPESADGGAIQYDNPTISRVAGKGNFARGLGYDQMGTNNLGLGMDDKENWLQNLLSSTGIVNSAQASEIPQNNGGFNGNTRYANNQQSSGSFADLPDNYLSDSGMGLLGRQRQEQTPQPEDKQITDNYEDDYTGGGGNVPQINNGQQPERGKLSRREYKAKYGIDYDPTGGLGDFGYAGDDSFKDQGNEIQDQLKNMIKGIEAQYATAQTKQTGDLERQGRQNLNQLNSQFSFGNSDPNDEQRIQYQQRLQNDQGRNLAELLSSLQASKGQDILGARNQGSTNMQNLMNQQRTARSTAQGNQRDYQTELAKARSGSRTKGIFAGYNQDGTKKYVNPYTGEEMFSGGQGTDPTKVNNRQPDGGVVREKHPETGEMAAFQYYTDGSKQDMDGNLFQQQ